MSAAGLSEGIGPEVSYSSAATIASLFAEQAERTPQKTALIAGARVLSYTALDEQSNRVARRLQALGAGPDQLVGVALGRSASLVVAMLGILKAGAAYVPLDPSYPADRLALMIEDSGMQMMVTDGATRPRLVLNEDLLEIVNVDGGDLSSLSGAPVASSASGGNLAYVIYTSGSTGRPKGVMVEHRNAVNFFASMDLAIGAESGVWLAVTSVSFDISILELFWTLTRGFTVVLHGDEGPQTMADEIERHNVTHLQMTPSLARMLILDVRAFEALGDLRQMLLGGEAVPASLIQQLRKNFACELFNMYGPTETTIWSTVGRIGPVTTSVSIGRPVANTQVYLLNEALKPVTPGEVGELWIGGDGVARGYWQRRELTAERFLELPKVGPGRIYRTGDLARFQADGSIDFLGRVDYQIKLRGHRIEPGEIEALLEKHESVRQAVVVLREDREGDRRLVAYLVASGSEPATQLLRSHVAAQLPEYMVPSAFVFLMELPLTDNGKIDRKALVGLGAPALASVDGVASTEDKSELERTIAAAWQDALGMAAVGLDENFFDLGAHSLTVAEVHAKLQQKLGRELALVDLFQYTTVRALAEHLGGAQSVSSLSDRAARRRAARQ